MFRFGRVWASLWVTLAVRFRAQAATRPGGATGGYGARGADDD